MSETKQFHLAGDGLSYRGVRMRVPDPDDLDAVMESVYRDAAGDSNKVIQMIPRKMLERCIVAITEPGIGRKEGEAARVEAVKKASEAAEASFNAAQKRGAQLDELRSLAQANAMMVNAAGAEAAMGAGANALMTAAWQPVTTMDLTLKTIDGKPNPKAFVQLFGTKDYATLRGIVQSYYDARPGDAELILGKALTVSGA